MRKKSEDQENKKGFPFLSLIAFVLSLLLFFGWGFFRSRAEDFTKVVDGNVYHWDDQNSVWVYMDDYGDRWYLPDPPPSSEPDVSEPETEPVTEPETDPETEPETDPETEPDTDLVFDDSDRLDLLVSDVSAIKSILLFSLVGVAAVLLLYMCYRVIRNFM